MTTIPAADLAATIDAERARRDLTRQQAAALYADRFGGHADTAAKWWRRAMREEVVDLDFADRWLTALDLSLDDLPAPPMLPGRARGGGHPTGVYGYLTDAQVLACHRLYESGLSLREVAERILPRTRYATAKACAESLRRRFVRLGLERRGQAEHLVTHGRARRRHPNRSAYVAQWKRDHGVRPAVRCTAQKADGGPCRGWAVHGETMCNRHRAVELGAVA